MNILLVGYYGFDNFGDEWLCRQTQKLIHSTLPSCHIKIAVLRPNSLLHVKRNSITEMFAAILWADQIIFGGGGIFQNQTSRLSPFYYAAIMVTAFLFRRPYGLIGHSIGPLSGIMTTWFIKLLLKRTSLCTLRHPSILVPTAIISPDLSYYNASFLPHGTSTGKVAICFRQNWITPELSTFLQSYPVSISLICQDQQDLHYQKVIALPPTDLPQLSLIISMRYHACVWASLHGVPFIALGDDPKLNTIATNCGQCYLPLSEAYLLSQKIDDYRINWTHYQQLLAQTIPRFISEFKPIQVALSSTLNAS